MLRSSYIRDLFSLATPPRSHSQRGAAALASNRSRRIDRRGLTLLELVIVLTILVALSGMAIPLIDGFGHQSNAAVNATIVGEVNRAIGVHEARFEKHASGWDSLLNTGGSMFSKLHASLSAVLQVTTLTAAQVQSLQDAGIANIFDADESAAPNAPNTSSRNFVVGGKVATLTKPGAGAAILLDAFGINESTTDWPNEFVVFGLGSGTTLKGVSMMEIPLLQSVDPSLYYSRAVCVFVIPPAAGPTFPARYIGCFMADGSTMRMNMATYNQARSNN